MIFILFLSFFFFSIPVSSSSPSSDFSALLSFKQSLLQPTFLLSSWLNSTNPCIDSWYGVTCNPTTHRVTRLVLENLNLTGPIHPLTQLSHLRLLSLKHNNLSSSFNLNFSSSPNLKHLYLSHNHLSGLFPAGFSHLRRLHRLDLSHNYFSGVIPMSELVSLSHLLTVRLEGNSFVGTIDAVNPLSPSVMEFNVSDNNLSGGIPSWLSRFPASSFTGNDNLCGEPLGRECSNQTVSSQPAELGNVRNGTEKRASNWVVLMIVGIDAAAIAAAVVTITCCCRYYKRRRNDRRTHEEAMKKKGGSRPQIGGYYYGGGGDREGEEMVVFEGCKGFSDVDDLLKSSAELLGKGCVGTTYKVEMDGGGVVVVKRVRDRRRRKEVHGCMRIIGGLRHNNIVSLRAYYNSKEELLLVYDFLPNGSLHSLLHGSYLIISIVSFFVLLFIFYLK